MNTANVQLYYPFDPKAHPEASSVHERSVLWARRSGMFPTEQHIRAAHRAKAGWLVARGFPTAMPRGLQLIADWTVLFCALDDHIEKLGSANEVESYLQHLLEVFRTGDTGSSDDPFAAGMKDLQQRLLAMAPPIHFQKFADRLAELFAGNVTEARSRERGEIPDLGSYLRLREVTIGLQVMFSLVGVVEGFNLSDQVRDHAALQRLTTRTSNIVGWANDLFTFEKEILQGQTHNLVLVLMNERRLTIAEAVKQAVALHDREVKSFLQEVEQLPSFGPANAGVRRYVEMLKCWIRGHLDWAHETGRYQPFDVPAVRPAGRTAAA